MSMLEKVRMPRLRPASATPKEKQAWDAFVALVEELHRTDGAVSPMVTAELERLCQKGNPMAMRFRERLDAAAYQPRTADEPARPAPVKRRVTGLRWGKP